MVKITDNKIETEDSGSFFILPKERSSMKLAIRQRLEVTSDIFWKLYPFRIPIRNIIFLVHQSKCTLFDTLKPMRQAHSPNKTSTRNRPASETRRTKTKAKKKLNFILIVHNALVLIVILTGMKLRRPFLPSRRTSIPVFLAAEILTLSMQSFQQVLPTQQRYEL